jgi:hypothetical protein
MKDIKALWNVIFRVKVRLSLCLTKRHAMKTYWGVETAPRIPNLGARLRRVVSFMIRKLYLREKNSRYPLDIHTAGIICKYLIVKSPHNNTTRREGVWRSGAVAPRSLTSKHQMEANCSASLLPVSLGWEAEWTPGPILARYFWREQNPGRPACKLSL